MTVLTVESMGRRGEGVATHEGARIYVPYALPGETVEGELDGDHLILRAVIAPGADRIEPFCPYFGGCGGCAIQHWRSEPYRAWKRDLVVTALRQNRIETQVADTINAGGVGRRRATLHVRKTGDDAKAGFHAARSRDLYPIETCPILEPSMRNVPHIAAEIGMASGSCHVAFTATGPGLDVHVIGAPRKNAAHLARLANAYDLARIATDGDIISERIPPLVEMGRAMVKPPPGAFLQATKAGEDILAQLVIDGAGKVKHAADLFCGVGPFTIRLAETARVLAADSDKPSIAALSDAVNRTQGLKPVTAVRRDLFREPLTPRELNAFDTVIFDPPRAGAEAQARSLARSQVKTVIGVSCDPGTFARDAEILIAGGYSLEKVTPVDQFVHSMHVELVGVFRRQSLARST
ncbi:methyltransferase [soil metagenome]